LTEAELDKIVEDFKTASLKKREERIRPGLDSKIISGWNGLVLSGLCDTYVSTGDEKAKKLSQDLAIFLKTNMVKDGKLLHTDGQSIEGFLEDYAAIIQGFLTYYETFFEEEYLYLAKQLTDHVVQNFHDPEEGFFYFTSNEAEALIARKKEVFDNVIPASNSIMAENLYRLSVFFDNSEYRELQQSMLDNVSEFIKKDPEFTSNWARLATSLQSKPLEIAIVGKDYQAVAMEMKKKAFPNQVFMASATESELPLMEYKTSREGETTIYVCSEKVYLRPVTALEVADKKIANLMK